MISAASPRSNPVRAGFTLLEIILAITIVVIISTMGIVMFRSWKSQKALEEALSGIETCARTAYGGILTDQRPWIVVFTKTRCAAYDTGALPEDERAFPPAKLSFKLDDDQTLFLKRANWPDWKEIVIPEAWRFEPRALLEPIEVRLESPKGWIQGRFNPLTARLDGVEMEAK